MARSNVSVRNKCDLFPSDFNLETNKQTFNDEFTFDFSILNKNCKKDVRLEETLSTQVPCAENLLKLCPPSNSVADRKNTLAEDKLDPALSVLLDGWKSKNDQEHFNKSYQGKNISKEIDIMVNKLPNKKVNSHPNTKGPKINGCSDLLSGLVFTTPENKNTGIATKLKSKIDAKHPASLSSDLSDMLSSMHFNKDDKLGSNSLGSSPDSGIGSCSDGLNLNASSDEERNNIDDDGISMMDLLETLDIQPAFKKNPRSLDCSFDFQFEANNDTSKKQKSNNIDVHDENTENAFLAEDDVIDLSSCIKSKTQDIKPLPKVEEENLQISNIPITPFPIHGSITDYPEKAKIRVNMHQSDFCKAIAVKFERNKNHLEKAKNIKVEMYQNMFNQRCRLSIPKSAKLLFLYNQSWDFKNKSPQKFHK